MKRPPAMAIALVGSFAAHLLVAAVLVDWAPRQGPPPEARAERIFFTTVVEFAPALSGVEGPAAPAVPDEPRSREPAPVIAPNQPPSSKVEGRTVPAPNEPRPSELEGPAPVAPNEPLAASEVEGPAPVAEPNEPQSSKFEGPAAASAPTGPRALSGVEGPARTSTTATSPGGNGSSSAAQPTGASYAALIARLGRAAEHCYPAQARRLRLRGEVLLNFCLDAGGAAAQQRVTRSSGAALLDRAAQECVLPGALPAPGVQGCFNVPIRFGG